ncbi:MAG: ROK family transcriptional regulator [Limnochordia bacterium]|nr:ROK family transcriptional regulator [Limnochordia bacterium]
MTTTRKFDSAYLRRVNCVKTFCAIREQGSISRSELAGITGLSRATVSETVRELLERQFVREVGSDNTSRGRPPVKLEVNPLRFYLVAVEIDVGWIVVAVTTLVGEVLVKRREEFKTYDYDFVLDLCRRTIDDVLAQQRIRRDAVLGVGVAVPGQVDLTRRVVTFAPNLRWRDAHLADDLQGHLHLPVLVSNEAMLAAMAEKWFGRGRDAGVLVYVSVKGGLGCGIMNERSLNLGVSGSAGELGHMSIDPHGPKCSCGSRGCWEVYADEEAIIDRASRALSTGQDSLLLQSTTENRKVTVEDIVWAASQGDRVAMEVLRESAWYLGVGIANIVNGVNPDLVIVGGRIAASQLLLDEVTRVVRERSLQIPWQIVRLAPTQLGDEVALMGCIALLLDTLLEQPDGRLNAESATAN